MPSKMIQALRSLTREGITRISEATTRFDDWQNQVTGFGTSIDKTTYTQYVGGLRLPLQQLSNLYHGDDLAARMVDIVPDELLREGFTVDLGDATLNTAISDQLDALQLDAKLADAWRWGRLYGGAALVLGANDGRSAATPLVAEKANGLDFVHVVDRRYLWPLTYYSDSTNPKLGLPETYMVSASSTHADQGFAVVHESRLVLFGGATTGSLEREQNNSWDHSVLERALQPLAAFNTGWKAVELLLTDANQAVFKMNGLSEVLGASGEETAKARMKVVDLFRSVMRAIVVDAGSPGEGIAPEEFTRQSVSFTDIPATLDKFMLRLAAAVQIPVTILMGQSPAGMNATGDSDFRWFYDRIRSEQTRKLASKIRRIVKVMLATKALNAKPERIEIKFPPLWTEPPLQQAQTRKAILDGDAVAISNGILVPAEVAAKRFGEANGFDSEIQLSDEGKAARDAELKSDLEDLSKPPDESEPPDDGSGGGGGFGGGDFGRSDADDQPRDDDGRFASSDGGGGSGGAGKGGSTERGTGSEQVPAHESRHAARAAVSAALPEARVAQGKDAKPGVVRQASKEELGQDGQNAGAHALYVDSTNEVLLSEDTIRGAAAAHDYIQNSAHYSPGFIDKDVARGYGNVDHLYQLSVVHHEELHSMSRSSGESYRGAGAVLEEVGTELAAMHVTQNAAAHLAKEASLRGHLLDRSGYANKVRGVQRVIEQHTGKNGEEALDAIRNAHVRSALNGGKPFATGAEHVRAFAQALDVPATTREAIEAKLGRMRL